MNYRFKNRAEAGVMLANKLKNFSGRADILVLGLPRGGIPVAYQVAKALSAPLEAFLVRKLGAPGHEEFAIGAVASGGICFLNQKTIRWLQIPEEYVQSGINKEKDELARREQLYREGLPPIELHGKTVIIVDDGLATGASMKAAVMAVRTQEPTSIVAAVPVGAQEVCTELSYEVDELVCVQIPSHFYAVGEWYEDFGQVSDEEVRTFLKKRQSIPELSYETR